MSNSVGREAIEAARRLDVRWWISWSVFIGMGLVAAQQYSGPRPRSALDSALDIEHVSAARARETLSILLGEEERVHRAGQPDNEHVRVRLLGLLDELGLQTWVMPMHLSEKARQVMQPKTEPANVVARIAGAARARPVVLATHYDSAKESPGAGDAGQCVAAILETARVLKSQPLKYEIWLLLTDAEEFGMWGSEDFITQGNFPWGEELPIVISFDARGDRGAVLLYETHGNNLRAMQLAAEGIAAPKISTSLMVNVYKRLPNGTDFTNYRKAGWCGWNFAVVAGAERYHTANDTLANLSSRSLQYFASHAHQLLIKLDTQTADQLKELDQSRPAVFFDVLGLFLVVYPEYGNWWHLAGVALVFMAFCIVARRHMRPSRVLLAVVVIALLMAVCCGLGWSMVRGLRAADCLPRNFINHYEWLMLIFPMAASAVVFGSGRLVRNWCHRQEIVAAVVLVYGLFAAAVCQLLPGGAYLFLWPALALAIGGCMSGFISAVTEPQTRLVAIAWCLIPALFFSSNYVLLAQALGPRAGMLICAGAALMLLPTWIAQTGLGERSVYCGPAELVSVDR